jgi:membrane-bound lytic murein transglycosylase MltF
MAKLCINYAVIILALLLPDPAGAADTIPAKARQYRLDVRNEYRRVFGMDTPADAFAIGASTIHQESSWNPRAQSAYANGLTQFTPGTWTDVNRWDPTIASLGDVWSPRAAIRAMAVYHKRLWSFHERSLSSRDRWNFVTSSYNGGLGWTQRDIAICYALPAEGKPGGCNSQKWFGNVELRSARSYEAFRENRTYVANIWNRWRVLFIDF